MGSCLLKSNPGLCGSVQSTLIWVPLVNSSHCIVFALLLHSVLGLVTRPNTSAAFAVLESATQYHMAVLFCDWAQRCSYQPIGYLVVCCFQPICVAPFRVWHHTQWPRMHNICAQTSKFAHNPIPSVLSGRRVGVDWFGWDSSERVVWLVLLVFSGLLGYLVSAWQALSGQYYTQQWVCFLRFPQFHQLHVSSHLDWLHQRGHVVGWFVSLAGCCLWQLCAELESALGVSCITGRYRATSAQGKFLCPYYLLVFFGGITCEYICWALYQAHV
jgi:hypothetical protein